MNILQNELFSIHGSLNEQGTKNKALNVFVRININHKQNKGRQLAIYVEDNA